MSHVPRPRLTMVDTSVGADGGPVSVITRIWPRAAASRCTLCPRCNARPMLFTSLCVVSTPGFTCDGEAAMHRFDVDTDDAFPRLGEPEPLWAELIEDDA